MPNTTSPAETSHLTTWTTPDLEATYEQLNGDNRDRDDIATARKAVGNELQRRHNQR